MLNETRKKIHNIFEKILCKKIYSIEKNKDSSDGNVYIINCKTNKYVLKIYDNKKLAKSMVMLHKKLYKLNINVPNIIYDNLNDESKEYIVIYSFIEGKQINDILQNGKVDIQTISYISKVIRKLHDINYKKNEFEIPELPFEAYKMRETILHFDLTKDNIFLDKTNNIAIIDFDDAKYGSAIYDISILISTFFFSKKRGIDIEGMNKFIEEYYGEDTDLRDKEVPLIKNCAIQWIKFLIDECKINEKLIDSFNAKIKIINEFFEKELREEHE